MLILKQLVLQPFMKVANFFSVASDISAVNITDPVHEAEPITIQLGSEKRRRITWHSTPPKSNF
jgi:hypothetical protein